MLHSDGAAFELFRSSRHGIYHQKQVSTSAVDRGAVACSIRKWIGRVCGPGRSGRSIFPELGIPCFALTDMATMAKLYAIDPTSWQAKAGDQQSVPQATASAHRPG